jgi:ubiquitin C
MATVVQMQINLSRSSGRRFPLMVKSSDTIIDVKKKIHEEEGDPVHDQLLIFDGRQLDDKKTLANYNILENTTIHLVRRMQGN